MFHPEPLSLLLSTLALWLCVRTFASPRYMVALGVTLGAAQLVRAFALWTVAAVFLALLAGRRWRELTVVLALAVVIPAPWYIHQRLTYGGQPEFSQPAQASPLPSAFYFGLAVPGVITKPYRTQSSRALDPGDLRRSLGRLLGRLGLAQRHPDGKEDARDEPDARAAPLARRPVAPRSLPDARRPRRLSPDGPGLGAPAAGARGRPAPGARDHRLPVLRRHLLDRRRRPPEGDLHALRRRRLGPRLRLRPRPAPRPCVAGRARVLGICALAGLPFIVY